MKTSWVMLIPLLALATTSCHSLRSGNDALCSEIARFANTTAPGQTQEIVFETSWGLNEKFPGSLGAKLCEHKEQAPGMRLCDYLVDHSSTEFAEYNFGRVLACMNVQKRRPPDHVSIERMDTLMWAGAMNGVREDVSVGVEFVMGADRSPTLKIMATADEPL